MHDAPSMAEGNQNTLHSDQNVERHDCVGGTNCRIYRLLDGPLIPGKFYLDRLIGSASARVLFFL